MEDREMARMHKYGGSKTTQIMMATVPHVTSGLGLRKFQADGFLLTQVYICIKRRNFWNPLSFFIASHYMDCQGIYSDFTVVYEKFFVSQLLCYIYQIICED